MIIFHVILIYCSEFSMNMTDTKFDKILGTN